MQSYYHFCVVVDTSWSINLIYGKRNAGKRFKIYGKRNATKQKQIKKTQIDLLDKTTKQAIHYLFLMLLKY